MGDAMKSADPHGAERHTKQVLDPLAHLARSLVGEGHRHDAERRDAFDAIQPGDAVHQHTCFATARPGLNQQMSGGCSNGLTLRIVQ